MEIRHRKQWLTGKMIAQVRAFDPWPWEDAAEGHFKDEKNGGRPPPRPIPNPAGYQPTIGPDKKDTPPPPSPKATKQQKAIEIRHDDAYWNDKYEDLLKIAGEFRDERNLLRSQLSEALGKIREYREAAQQPAQEPFPEEEYQAWLKEGYRQMAEMELRKEKIAEGISEPRECVGAIPHHGPGLSEAEDAMRDVCDDFLPIRNRKKGQLLLVYQNAPFGGIYYRLMDRETRRDIKGGIAKDKADMLANIDDADKEKIHEVRTYGMGVV